MLYWYVILFNLGECKEYYEDPWIFGEEEETEDSADNEGDADESGSGEGSGGAVGKYICLKPLSLIIKCKRNYQISSGRHHLMVRLN